ncbi:hypothetical protein UA08_04616 [Talaromyces atroroseus]|uniref:HMG box domain-containing protein n=1 Tax=Talaromyces atroroseus TaxID=1441469 RepID=A0A225AGX4_TALAT|nr:hypothetical protein UA08_04616 [Talaromyces atroroseus]OKL59970.1 hypothetical protein UA08_04616 [Talaromyces atroroseus]
MIAPAPSTSHSARASVCSDDHLSGQPQNRPSSLYRQFSNDSVDPNSMGVSRMSSMPTYADSPSFASDAASHAPVQVDDSPLYPESVSHGLSPESGILTTRGGKSFQFPPSIGIRNMPGANKVRVLKTPRVRRRPKTTTKPDKAVDLVITAPLSQLTKHMVHIPIKDMDAWVNRTVEVRRREVAQKNGKIARPMNSFMLYRSAYAERTKQWCSQNNHQVVSRVSGQSWPKEPPEVREKYEYLALIERDNHQRAHPEYKFAPNKTQTSPRKKRPLDDEDSEADENVYHGPLNASPMPHKIIKSSGLNSGYNSRESTPFDNQDSVLPEPYHHNPWPVSVGRHLPPRMMAGPEQQHHGYYVSTHGSYPNMIRPSDDSHPAARQGGFAVNGVYNTSTGLAGIPGSINQELLRPYGSSNNNTSSAAATATATASSGSTGNNNNHSNAHVATRMDDNHLDPQLLSSHQAGIDMRPYNMSTLWHHDHQGLGPYMPMSSSMGNHHGLAYNSLTAAYGSMQQLEEGQPVWTQGEDDGIAVPEVGKDFDQWIHSQNHHAVYGSQ